MGIGRNSFKAAKEKAKQAGKKIRDAKPQQFMSKSFSRIPTKGVNEIKPSGINKSPANGNAFTGAMAKAGGNYLSSTLISTEAKRLGFDEGIALSTDGKVSEGAGENLFMVKNNILFTPPASAGILTGITRDTVIELSKNLGLTIKEEEINRESLYLADEMFFTGTAAEVTPIRSIDRIDIGDGKRGPITEKLQEKFFGLFNGNTEDSNNWLESI